MLFLCFERFAEGRDMLVIQESFTELLIYQVICYICSFDLVCDSRRA